MSRFTNSYRAAAFVMAAFLLPFVSCIKVNQPSNNTPTLYPPSYPSTAPAGESDTIRWDAVKGALSYVLYYSTDGSSPTTHSASIQLTGDTVYVHTGLDPALTYTYSVQVMGRGTISDLSESSWGVQPLPMIHATCTFDNYPNSNVGFIFFQVDGSTYVPITSTRRTIPASTDGFGSATFNVTVDHDNYWGYSIFKDMNYDGQLSAGDTVWGNNTSPGRYGYYYWKTQFTSSKTFTISFDSNTVFDSLPHVF